MSNEPRQRWRIVVARDTPARDVVHREVAAAWEAGLTAGDLPLAMSVGGTPRPRISFAAPAPLGMLAARELIDVVLTELVTVDRVRAAVQAAAPAGYRVVDLYDIWIGSSTLPSLVVAGDYRMTLHASDAGGGPLGLAEVQAAVDDLLAAPRIERQRSKGQGTATVDIRPHLFGMRVTGDAAVTGGSAGASASPGLTARGVRLWMRLRLGGEGGVGRPEEVVAALGERLERLLIVDELTRERIVLADDPDA